MKLLRFPWNTLWNIPIRMEWRSGSLANNGNVDSSQQRLVDMADQHSQMACMLVCFYPRNACKTIHMHNLDKWKRHRRTVFHNISNRCRRRIPPCRICNSDVVLVGKKHLKCVKFVQKEEWNNLASIQILTNDCFWSICWKMKKGVELETDQSIHQDSHSIGRILVQSQLSRWYKYNLDIFQWHHQGSAYTDSNLFERSTAPCKCNSDKRQYWKG